jgi:TolB-like protein
MLALDRLREVLAGLTVAISGRYQSLAVLPLENLSGDPSQEYFADGMTDADQRSLAIRGH